MNKEKNIELYIKNNLISKIELLIKELKVELESNINRMGKQQSAKGCYMSGGTIKFTIDFISEFTNNYYENIFEHLKSIINISNENLEKEICIFVQENLNSNKEYLISKLKTIIGVVGRHNLSRLYETQIPKIEDIIIHSNDKFKNKLETYFLHIRNEGDKQMQRIIHISGNNNQTIIGNNNQQQMTNNDAEIIAKFIEAINRQDLPLEKKNSLIEWVKDNSCNLVQIVLGIVGII